MEPRPRGGCRGAYCARSSGRCPCYSLIFTAVGVGSDKVCQEDPSAFAYTVRPSLWAGVLNCAVWILFTFIASNKVECMELVLAYPLLLSSNFIYLVMVYGHKKNPWMAALASALVLPLLCYAFYAIKFEASIPESWKSRLGLTGLAFLIFSHGFLVQDIGKCVGAMEKAILFLNIVPVGFLNVATYYVILKNHPEQQFIAYSALIGSVCAIMECMLLVSKIIRDKYFGGNEVEMINNDEEHNGEDAELRQQLEAELRPKLEAELRPKLEAELRPMLEAELKNRQDNERVEVRVDQATANQGQHSVASSVPSKSNPSGIENVGSGNQSFPLTSGDASSEKKTTEDVVDHPTETEATWMQYLAGSSPVASPVHSTLKTSEVGNAGSGKESSQSASDDENKAKKAARKKSSQSSLDDGSKATKGSWKQRLGLGQNDGKTSSGTQVVSPQQGGFCAPSKWWKVKSGAAGITA